MADKGERICLRALKGGRIHMIGIGGCSMSGLALLLKSRNYTVSGSSMGDSEYVKELLARGIEVMTGDCAGHVDGANLVVYSHAIQEDNVELLAAKEKGIPVMSRSQLLGQISEEFSRSVSVCGTHGKTTVTSMLAQILIEAGADPTVHIGGVLPSMGGSVRAGESDVFLTEACEFQRSFLDLYASDIVLLNIDEDHLDCYRDIDEIESAFGAFLQKLPADGWALGNGEDERVVRQLQSLKCRSATFGFSAACDYRIENSAEDARGYFQFDFCHGREKLGHICMAVPGSFNAMNAAAALAEAHHLGIDMRSACRSIESFTGAHRRFERTGTLHGAELFHDYGHNPAEMRNALSIARKRCDHGRLWAVMQPHTYSRVKTLFQDYLSCTQAADITLVTDIYAAREADPGDIDSGMLAAGMNAKGINAVWTPRFEDAAALLRSSVRAGDLVLTMGCGNIYLLNDMLREMEDDTCKPTEA